MRLPTNAHVAIVDGENFIVMRNSGQPLEPKLGAAEKPDLSATNFSAGVKHHDVLVIADPETLGEMRRHYHSELEKRLVGEIDKTMSGEPTERIEQVIANA